MRGNHKQYLEDAANEPIECDLRYQGQIQDKETGLYYNRHRYYDPDSGQYLSSDPIGFAGGFRPQGYVHNPLEWCDPLGLAGHQEVKLLALQAPRQIDATWGVNNYRHGGEMQAIEHINYRHSYESGFVGVSRFNKGTRIKDIHTYVDKALRYGNITPKGNNRYEIQYNLNFFIGTDKSGANTSIIKVFVRDGKIQTAFPF